MSFRIEKLRKEREVGKFDCGASDQNRYLRGLAWQNMQLGYGVTYVALEDMSSEGSSGNDASEVSGLYSLAAGRVEFENLPEDFRGTEGLPRYPAPTVLVGQLGVDLSAQGRGLGKALLAHAIKLAHAIEKAVQVSEVVGAVAIEVHAATEQAREFYRRYGFVQMQDSPDHLFLSMEVGRSLIEAAR